MRSSNQRSAGSPYTTTRIPGAKKTWIASTIAIAAVAVGGGVLVDMWLNPNALSTPGPTATGTSDMTVTGDAIQYRYGVIQVEVVRKGGKITAVNMIQSDATAGREQAFPYLTDYALKAQGTNFGNLSGATFTTDAFKQALDSAISKLS